MRSLIRPPLFVVARFGLFFSAISWIGSQCQRLACETPMCGGALVQKGWVFTCSGGVFPHSGRNWCGTHRYGPRSLFYTSQNSVRSPTSSCVPARQTEVSKKLSVISALSSTEAVLGRQGQGYDLMLQLPPNSPVSAIVIRAPATSVGNGVKRISDGKKQGDCRGSCKEKWPHDSLCAIPDIWRLRCIARSIGIRHMTLSS